MARSRKFLERRAIRNQLKTFLDTRGWTDLTYAEGFSKIPSLEPPFLAILLNDFGPTDIDMGRGDTPIKTYDRRVQIEVYMEDEDRVNALTDDISDFLDLDTIYIYDTDGTTSLGIMTSDTNTISSITFPPIIEAEKNLRWRGAAYASYTAQYLD